MTQFRNLSLDDTLGGNSPSDYVIPSQKAIKEYVDTGLSDKQDSLTAGTGIDITNDTISVVSPTLINTATQARSITILGTAATNNRTINIGYDSLGNWSDSVIIGGSAKPTGECAVAIGNTAEAYYYSTALGYGAKVKGQHSIAIGQSAIVDTDVYGAIQIGYGTNTEAKSLNIGFWDSTTPVNYKLLGSDGKIPSARIPDLSSTYQATLVSGTNIKTINNQSILGSGNLTIGGGSVETDGKSITTNSSDELQTVGVIDQNNTTNAIKTWTGTKAQYDAITTKDSNTLYNITDDANPLQALLETIYPVGSIYIGTMAVCPLSALFGTWQLVSSGMVLQGSDNSHVAGSTIEAGLPNIVGSYYQGNYAAGGFAGIGNTGTTTGAFYDAKNAGTGGKYSYPSGDTTSGLGFDASLSNSIYGNSNTVQPPAFVVNIWQRTA
jgi:hypothetical protein